MTSASVKLTADHKLEWHKAVFNNNPHIDYASQKQVSIGLMNVFCSHCNTLKRLGEAKVICCSGGKVKLPLTEELTPALFNLLMRESQDSKHFRGNIGKYNSAFQMTSFGADKYAKGHGFFTTFKTRGQCYHRLGSLLPLSEEDAKFAQVSFMGSR